MNNGAHHSGITRQRSTQSSNFETGAVAGLWERRKP